MGKVKISLGKMNLVFCNNQRWKPKMMGFLISLIFFSGVAVFGQNTQTVRGKVVDESNESLPGVNVILKNSTTGTVTDIDGNFSLTIPAGAQTLEISFVGMVTQEVGVTGTDPVTVVMKESQLQLEEVVVVGYGVQKKESVVGAITQTTGKVLERSGGVSDLGMALTGNLPGVVTMSSTGMPGEEDPQIVIRGRSSWNNTDPLVLVDGIERPMNSVDINSVESISVLKDASATAVFGVRGANGVILITTKRGKEGKANIDFNFSATMKTPSKLPAKYDSYDALMYLNQAIENELAVNPDAWSQIMPYSLIQKYRHPANQEQAERFPNIDWRKETFKNFAMSYNANMSISGGTPFVKYFANLDYQREGDIYREIDNNRGYNAGYGFDRMNVRSNLDFSLTPTTTLKVGLSGSHGVRKGLEEGSGNVNLYTAWTAVYVTAPDALYPRFSDGSWGYHAPNYTDGSQLNPLSNIATKGVEYRTTDRINTDFSLNQDLGMVLKGLNARVLLSFDNEYRENERGVTDLNNAYKMKYIDPKTGAVSYLNEIDSDNRFDFQESVAWRSRAGAIQTNSVYRRLYYSVQLNYANTFFTKHNVTAMGDFNREEDARGSNEPLYRENWVFRATYDYARKYLLEYNGSYNGSDKFASENRFVFFQSGAIGWMVTEESFVKNLDLNWLDMLKLRASYGKIGADNIPVGRWAYLTTWDLRKNAAGENWGFRQSINGENNAYAYDIYYESNVGNLDIRWETITKFNLGTDFSFFKGLATGNVEIFRDKRRDVFIGGGDRSVPSYYGATPANTNLGAVDVKGLELELRLSKSFNDLRLWSNFAYTHAIDKVIERDDAGLLADYRKQAGYAVGQPRYHVDAGYINNWDELYGSTAHDNLDGMRTPGGYVILDYDADGIISNDDRIPYSFSRTPQNTFNATLGADYKGWSFFVQLYGVTNVTREASYTSLEHNTRHTVYEYQGNYWNKDNQNADWPKLVYGARQSSYATGTRYNFDASYLRLKNVELAYTFNQDHKWMRSIGIKSLKLYLNGNNIWIYTHMPDDRESNNDVAAFQSAYPTMKRFNLGLRISL